MNILSAFFKKLIGGDIASVFITILVGLMLLIAIPNLGKMVHLFGYETKAQVQQKLIQANAAVDTAVDANKGQTSAIADLVASLADRDTVQVDTTVKKQAVVKKAIKREEAKQVKIKMIETTSIPEIDKDKEISRVQIDFLWTTYCEYNESPSCPAPVPATT